MPLQVPGQPTGGAMVLKVADGGFTALGMLSHPWQNDGRHSGMIRRALVAAGSLWTVSDAGLKANDLTTLGGESWIAFA